MNQPETGAVKVEALHYRCLRYVSQKLRPFQILVGPNASGKSTFLDVIAFLGDLVRTDLETAVRGDSRLAIPLRAPDPAQVTWLRSQPAFELAVELADPSEPSDGGRPARVRYELRIEVDDEPRIATENVWLLDNGKTKDSESARQLELFPRPEPPPDHLVILPKRRAPRGYRKVIGRGEPHRARFRSERGNWNAPFALTPQKTALASLPEDHERFPRTLRLRELLTAGVSRLVLASEKMRRPAPPTRRNGFEPDGSNLPYVIDRLKKGAPDRFERWVDHVREALPDIEDISTEERPEDRHRYLVIHYRSDLLAPSWLVSDGTLRMLALTLLAYSHDVEGGIYLIEEPENGVHPRAVEIVYQSLSSVYRAQILLATHSPVILGLAKPEDLLCFARDQSGATDIIGGDAHPALKAWKGEIDVPALFAMGVLG